jgi:hypothetical protein
VLTARGPALPHCTWARFSTRKGQPPDLSQVTLGCALPTLACWLYGVWSVVLRGPWHSRMVLACVLQMQQWLSKHERCNTAVFLLVCCTPAQPSDHPHVIKHRTQSTTTMLGPS